MDSPAAFKYLLALDDSGRRGRLVTDLVESWLEVPALREIVTGHGGPWPDGDLASRLEILNDFSQEWDFRGGTERLDIDVTSEIDEQMIERLAPELGMTVSLPPTRASYDHALILGGTALASVNRTKRLAELVDDGLGIGNVAVLTALRELPANEAELAREKGVSGSIMDGSANEFEVMVRAASEYLAGGSESVVESRLDPNPNLSSASASFQDRSVQVLAAPSGDPGRRANTLDNYAVYEESIAPGESVLIVTSSIYLPYQFFVAVKSMGLKPDLTLEAVGFPPEWMDGILTGPRNVLQELRSAFFGAKNLIAALDS